MTAPRKRLSHENRRVQLLDTAAAIVRAEGADALTLARVAEEAGVSKPIAYDHFGTRAGLLHALYLRVDAQQCEAARAAVEARAETLEKAVEILAASYVDCVLHIGGEYGTITAALSTFPEAEALLRAGRERYARIYLAALERFVPMAADEGVTVMLGVIGAAEALAREVTAGRISRADAIKAIRRIMLGAMLDS
ncbi:MAG: helix-turn-helix domain-containing protein [Caulobacteraceae bacterium]